MFTNSHSSSSWLIFVISYYLFIISLLSTSSIVSGYNGYGPYVLGELTLPGRMEIDARCPKAFLDYRYNECRDDVRVDWSGTKNALKAECCYVLDDAHCIRESVKRNCPPEVLDFMDEILLSTESQWRYSTECHDYYKRSLCHFPIWAIVLLSIVGAILLFGCIGGIIYWKCCR
uniref:Uncharacterized protein n=1 Tax=Tetranychus urticae TaxID=32264 RepID=T1KMZ2_TETUR